ncbi:MAG TPA: hypothetical protein VER04_08160 [Polyangiaceae bacterium]|nr:hypothetical protein [Polyangiaceae bacterium]
MSHGHSFLLRPSTLSTGTQWPEEPPESLALRFEPNTQPPVFDMSPAEWPVFYQHGHHTRKRDGFGRVTDLGHRA